MNSELGVMNCGLKTDLDIYERAFRFAVEVVHLSDELYKSRDSKAVIAKQLIRSRTSVGANLEEGRTGQSKADFIAKLSISRKEAVASLYWLRLLAVLFLVFYR